MSWHKFAMMLCPHKLPCMCANAMFLYSFTQLYLLMAALLKLTYYVNLHLVDGERDTLSIFKLVYNAMPSLIPDMGLV